MENSKLFFAGRLMVPDSWIDYNGHMNVGFYSVAFDKATDTLFDEIGIGQSYKNLSNASMFCVETHLTYEREVGLGDPLIFHIQMLDYDEKRIQLFHMMRHETKGYLAATMEFMGLHVDIRKKKAAIFPALIKSKLSLLMKSLDL